MNKSALEAMSGDWVGGFLLGNESAFLRANFTVAQGSLTGTADLLFVSGGGRGLPLGGIRHEPGRLCFTLVRGTLPLVFDAALMADSLTGEVAHGAERGTFQLARVAEVTIRHLDDYTGIYQGEGSRLIAISRYLSDDLGESSLTYHDYTSGRLGLLFPRSQGTFFAGPALLAPLPPEVEITLAGDATDRAMQLTWREGGSQASATRAALAREEVRFRNGDVLLAGTLTLPATPGPHPAAVFIHGSGPASRNAFGPDPDFFALHGIATLAYDKRGVGRSTGNPGAYELASLADLAGDAMAGVELLRHHPAIKPQQVGLWGRSQGGWVAPLAASRSQDVAFIVLNVSPAVTPAQQELARVEQELRADGFTAPEVAEAIAYVNLLARLVGEDVGGPELDAAVNHARRQGWSGYVGLPPVAFQVQWAEIYRQWAQQFPADHDPEAVLRRVHCPVLALFGELDRVVPAEENQQRLERALAGGGNRDYTTAILPGANHRGLIAETGGRKEFPRLKVFAAQAATLAVTWILQRTGTVR